MIELIVFFINNVNNLLTDSLLRLKYSSDYCLIHFFGYYNYYTLSKIYTSAFTNNRIIENIKNLINYL